jgi:hypothetical protein
VSGLALWRELADRSLSRTFTSPTLVIRWSSPQSSFADHEDRGNGTLLGILSKVDYLKDLGIDVIWLSPIYTSPMADMGYDISDYQAIDPRYGTLEDWDKLRDAVHARGMKLVMDLVVNHSSDQHAWFKESRSSKSSPKRDWYIWNEGKTNEKGERVPPNNWRSIFGAGSTWEWDEGSQEFYLHTFLKEQPDLNWENPEVRDAVFKMMRWWLDRGADGFRVSLLLRWADTCSRRGQPGGRHPARQTQLTPDGRHQLHLQGRRLPGRPHHRPQGDLPALRQPLHQPPPCPRPPEGDVRPRAEGLRLLLRRRVSRRRGA